MFTARYGLGLYINQTTGMCDSLSLHAGAGRPVQSRHTHLCSYRRNLKNVCEYYTFILVPLVSVETRIMRMYVY